MTDDQNPAGPAYPGPWSSADPGQGQQGYPQQGYPQQPGPYQYPQQPGPYQYPQQPGPYQYPPQQGYPQQIAGQAYPNQAFVGVEQKRSPLAVVAVGVAALAVISVIAVVGIVLTNRSTPSTTKVATSPPGPAITSATTTPTPVVAVTPTTPPPARSATPPPTTGPGGAHDVQSVALSKGDCLKTLPKGSSITSITLVNCTTPHAAQVGATFTPNDSSYPGNKAYENLITKECPARLQKVVKRDAAQLAWIGYYPEQSEWTKGDRSIKCLLIAANGKSLTRPVIG